MRIQGCQGWLGDHQQNVELRESAKNDPVNAPGAFPGIANGVSGGNREE